MHRTSRLLTVDGHAAASNAPALKVSTADSRTGNYPGFVAWQAWDRQHPPPPPTAVLLTQHTCHFKNTLPPHTDLRVECVRPFTTGLAYLLTLSCDVDLNLPFAKPYNVRVPSKSLWLLFTETTPAHSRPVGWQGQGSMEPEAVGQNGLGKLSTVQEPGSQRNISVAHYADGFVTLLSTSKSRSDQRLAANVHSSIGADQRHPLRLGPTWFNDKGALSSQTSHRSFAGDRLYPGPLPPSSMLSAALVG